MAGHRLVKLGLVLALLLVAIPLVNAQDNQGRICVAAYDDANMNGAREPMEPLLGDVVITLQNEQAVSVDTYVTNGQTEPHCFEGLASGLYLVSFSGGMVTATGETDYAVTLTESGIPAQVQFGASRADAVAPETAPAATSSNTIAGLDQNTLLRVIFAGAGALVVMVGMAAIGMLVYWLRNRQATE